MTNGDPYDKKEDKPDCSTGVNHPMDKSHQEVNRGRTVRIGGKRKTVGFKCDKELWNVFVTQSKERYGSVCHVLEPVIKVLVSKDIAVTDGEKALNIEGDLVIERVVKKPRRVYVEEQSQQTSAIKVPMCHYCMRNPRKNAVREVATVQARYKQDGRIFPLCQGHAKSLVQSGGWEIVR